MDFDKACEVFDLLSDNFEDAVLTCLLANGEAVATMIREQLYSGVDGNNQYLSPTYDTDPYFMEDGPWKGRSEQYKRWKELITPPVGSEMLFLPPRPVEVPNLFITGQFHDSITYSIEPDSLRIYTSGFHDGPIIESKYGEQIFMPTENAKAYFNVHYLVPALESFFSACGYK